LPACNLQRDELGLLSGRVLAKLGLLGGNSSQPPKPAREQQRRQQHAQQCTVQEAGEEGEESFGEPSSSLSWQGEEVVEVDLQHHDLRLGRSPDSDDLASTGSQLMEAFHEGPCANGGTCPRDGVRLQATAQQYSSSEKHEGCSSSGQQCGMAHLAGDEQQEAQAGIPEGSAGPHHHQQQQQQQQQEQGNTPTVDEPVSQQAVDAYSLPEHAQVAALLGQPTSGCLSVGSNSKPFRSPFVSELLHHSHPPGPLEAQQKQAGNLAAASGMLVADALALQRVAPAPSASNETFWLRDDGHGGAGGNGSGSYSAISRLPFSIRNAPLLRMIPKYCECWLSSAPLLQSVALSLIPVLVICAPEATVASGVMHACSCVAALPQPSAWCQTQGLYALAHLSLKTTRCAHHITAASHHCSLQTVLLRTMSSGRCWNWRTWRGRTATPAS
jgi:hypothetical protein